MDKNYRIHTNIISDTLLNVNMQQDFDFLEVLSLRLGQKDVYRLHSSNYGVIVGRVLANDAFGIPNAKISVFIGSDGKDSSDVEAIYPFSEVTSRDGNNRRYNLLPDYSDDECYRVVGTFPNKRLMLDNDTQLEIYDKYWLYTTVTNNAGDYMIFGVPTGSVTVHVDIDLSDIGVLSQKPRDFEYKGYNLTLFDSPNQFKESTNLDSLAQIFSQDRSVFVYPFWGDSDNNVASLTRADIQIDYKFEPTCVFMGSIVSDNEGHSIGHKCAPDINSGMNDQLIGGKGTIEMIRKTADGLVEEYPIRGNQLIDENGVWCYQIPMNLDFIGTDEYGNTVPTDNPSKGIPTRAQVRFRISKTETGDEGFSTHTAKYLVPMNPIFSEDSVLPRIDVNGSEIERMYNFGSATPDSCFRDLYWNNVYSVKNYIPKTQIARRASSKNYNALKGANLVEDQNPIPFNKLRIDVPFTYMMICVVVEMVALIVMILNMVLCVVHSIIKAVDKILGFLKHLPKWLGGFVMDPLGKLLKYTSCISFSVGVSEGDTIFYPGCWCGGYGEEAPEISKDAEAEGRPDNSTSLGEFVDRVQRNLALEYKIVKLDFYQDWINGVLYMPLWYWRKRKKKTFLFNFITLKRAKNEFCSCENNKYSRLRTRVACEIPYTNNSLNVNDHLANESENRWHRNRSRMIRYRRGLIRPFVNNDDLTVYYYSALQATTDNSNPRQALGERPREFLAVRLYATDIILLGNLNANNQYGIPQFFNCLPSTTANVPAIATIEEPDDDEQENGNRYFIFVRNNDDDDNSQYDSSTDSEDTGKTVVTGMDWRRKRLAKKDSPQYKKGLFMDLGCTFARTKAKSCINVERLSELGVALDTTHAMEYSNNGTGVQNGVIKADGFITKLELDDMENRAMFASMNHIGFIPQAYQDLTGSYDTQVMDENTNYLVPKFKYIYPVDFDGRLQVFMNRYRNGFKQALYDEADESYLTFRLGAERGNRDANNEKRIRHFYRAVGIDGNDDAYYMPLYNNSYYFYFGIKKGSTAIDKFNEMFNAQCFQNDKKPFTMIVDSRGESYCPTAYNNEQDGYGYIRVSSDDIRTPFGYELYDERNVLIISEEEMTARDFVIGGYIDENGNPQANEDGTIYYQKEPNTTIEVEPYNVSGLTNQTYTLHLIDADGKELAQRVTLDKQKITVDYNVTNLSSKFYSSVTTRIDYICNDDNHYYGTIDVTNLSIDGYDCVIDNVSYSGKSRYTVESGYTICISGHSEVSSSITASLSIVSIEGDSGATKNCMCDKSNDIAIAQGAADNMSISAATIADEMIGVSYIDEADHSQGMIISFFVYQPNSFACTITQGCESCDNLASDNSFSTIVTVHNADNFNTFLNTMPTTFMLGSVNDSVQASVSSDSNFYSLTAVTDVTDPHISGWFGVHQEDSYMFGIDSNIVSDRNQNLWEDFVNGYDDMHTIAMKKKVITMKFNAMFALSEAVYVQDDDINTFDFTSTGGIQPTLLRSIAPYYDDESKMFTSYLFKDDSSVDYKSNYPNIVGYNARKCGGDMSFNLSYNNPTLIGNYFAGFTHNGGYVAGTRNRINGDINISRHPNFASISPYSENKLKILGSDEEVRSINNVSKVHTHSTQQLTGDRSRQVNPWLRALNVDRRYDYDFVILGPVIGNNFKLHNKLERERPWKSLRISGTTYNGIEMSYDDEYNIISADTTNDINENVIYQEANKRLEYSYYYSSGDSYAHDDDYGDNVQESRFGTNPYLEAVTVYNHEEDCVWSTMHDIEYKTAHFGYNSGDTDDKQIIKEPYRNEFANFDIRNFYWSTFNQSRLSQYVRNDNGNGQIGGMGTNGYENLSNPFYVFGYPNSSSGLYNGDFNREQRTFNYPTRRFLDIGNIEPSNEYTFINEGCSYAIKAKADDDGFIRCKAAPKESTTFSVSFEPPINFISPNATNKEFGNIVYRREEDLDEGSNCEDWKGFVAKYANLNFTYNSKDNLPYDTFDVYTKRPMLIRVLPYNLDTERTDGITYIKSSNPVGEGLYGSDRKSLDDAISVFKFHTFNQTGNNIWSLINKDTFLPNDVTLNGDGFYEKNGERLPSNENDFTNIRFFKEKINLQGISVFTMLVDREYVYKDRDVTLTRHLRVVEFPELYDARHLLVRSISVSDNGETDTEGQPLMLSYVEYKKIDTVTPVEEPTGTTIERDEEGNVESVDVATEEKPKEGQGKLYTQVLSFEMKFNINEDAKPMEVQNYAFADYKNMGYIFEFVDSNDNKYFIENGVEVSEHEETVGNVTWKHLRFIVKWDQNMGILKDPKWAGWNEVLGSGKKSVKMAIYAKTPSNFTYKIFNGDSYFKINLASQDALPTEEGVRSKTVFCIE